MAFVENIPPLHADSEMEEGEIVDDLSDISSEEEFLLRQRLQVLENYNNVLERKKAKRSSIGPGTKHKKEDALLDLSEISATELEDYYSHAPQKPKVQKRQKIHHRQKRKKVEPIVSSIKTREYKRKNHYTKKKLEVKIISESSEESEDEYRNRRRKLANAVVVNKNPSKNDKTSLSERLQKMLSGVNPEPMKVTPTERNLNNKINTILEEAELSPISTIDSEEKKQEKITSCELIDLCTDEDSKTMTAILPEDTVDSVSKDIKSSEDAKKESDREHNSEKDSDEDLEMLRQHALKTKTIKANPVPNEVQPENKILSEDEDSDTAELRLICLKSALLKKAIERKQKQKLKKRLSQSQSTNFPDDLLNSNNNTDIESVDMDIGSDADDKSKEDNDGSAKPNVIEENCMPEVTKVLEKDIPKGKVPDTDELEDDEDLLRAKLLTSLSKNLPNLVNPNIIDALESIKEPRPDSPKPPQTKPVVPAVVVPEEKRFIITVGESDSEGEHEATKNLTKMHMKLSEQIDFQHRLDVFLKSTRMEVEKTRLPDVVQQPVPVKKNEKFVAKAVKHLPKSEQIEYKNLVKRMAELEKIKQARQTTINLSNKVSVPNKDTLKPRNTAIDASKLSAINNLEEKIQNSRKNIAEESAKMLKLKEEGVKLSQKYKIVATELRNIKTAIALNKRQTRSVQNCLTKIRLHHQMLLKSSMTSAHSKINGSLPPLNRINTRLQKENNPVKDDHKTSIVNKNIKVIVKENNLGKEESKNVVHKPIKDSNPSTEGIINSLVNKPIEANPLREEIGDPVVHKTIQDTNFVKDPTNPTRIVVKPSQVVQQPKLSVQLNVTSNKKVIKMTGCTTDVHSNTLTVDGKNMKKDLMENKRLSSHPLVEKGGGNKEITIDFRRLENNDYRSPLDAFGSSTWEGDPNAILCPFEVGGDCKDADCIYLHTQSRST
uniref:C3H1-type domain-containing protein n=1 Tax=Heliothis virescens TaxID=7102 RepID=A0A2A4JC47_HELVI